MCNESNDNHRVCPTQVFLESCFACGKANNLLTVECSSRSLISHAYSGARERVCVLLLLLSLRDIGAVMESRICWLRRFNNNNNSSIP